MGKVVTSTVATCCDCPAVPKPGEDPDRWAEKHMQGMKHTTRVVSVPVGDAPAGAA